jgi:hypothetical protein
MAILPDLALQAGGHRRGFNTQTGQRSALFAHSEWFAGNLLATGL